MTREEVILMVGAAAYCASKALTERVAWDRMGSGKAPFSLRETVPHLREDAYQWDRPVRVK